MVNDLVGSLESDLVTHNPTLRKGFLHIVK